MQTTAIDGLRTRGNLDGRIEIEITRKYNNTVVSVRDYAEGFSADDMDNMVSEYGGETSSFNKGAPVRGFFGRGLKDSIIGLGTGEVCSAKNGYYCECKIYRLYTDGKPASMYERQDPKKLDVANSTLIKIVVDRKDINVKIHRFDSLRRGLENHFELRMIMRDSNRRIILKQTHNGKALKEYSLEFKPPIGELILQTETSVEFQKDSKPISIEIYRSHEPLPHPAESGGQALGGMVFLSREIPLCNDMLKFDGNIYAERLYGYVRANFFHELL